jgi:hypothetical protein
MYQNVTRLSYIQEMGSLCKMFTVAFRVLLIWHSSRQHGLMSKTTYGIRNPLKSSEAVIRKQYDGDGKPRQQGIDNITRYKVKPYFCKRSWRPKGL